MPSADQRGACAPSRALYSSQWREPAGDHAISAAPGSRGNAMYSTSSIVRSVSDQIGASTPTMDDSGTFATVVGSQS